MSLSTQAILWLYEIIQFFKKSIDFQPRARSEACKGLGTMLIVFTWACSETWTRWLFYLFILSASFDLLSVRTLIKGSKWPSAQNQWPVGVNQHYRHAEGWLLPWCQGAGDSNALLWLQQGCAGCSVAMGFTELWVDLQFFSDLHCPISCLFQKMCAGEDNVWAILALC